MGDTFSTYHPAVNFLYFTLILLFTMVFMHPAALCISLAGAFAWSAHLGGRRALGFNLLYMVPMLLFSALLNPAFNHEGATILTYLPTGNPLTLESIVYGGAAAVMLCSVICWFT
ncbi:MAG: energy-coupling factor transporter transmembrane protein EcfT, partial [Oscillospiraceae bacterium]